MQTDVICAILMHPSPCVILEPIAAKWGKDLDYTSCQRNCSAFHASFLTLRRFICATPKKTTPLPWASSVDFLTKVPVDTLRRESEVFWLVAGLCIHTATATTLERDRSTAGTAGQQACERSNLQATEQLLRSTSGYAL